MLLTRDVPDASGPDRIGAAVILGDIVRPRVMLLARDVPDANGPVLLRAIARPPAAALPRILLAEQQRQDANVAARSGEMCGIAAAGAPHVRSITCQEHQRAGAVPDQCAALTALLVAPTARSHRSMSTCP